MPGMEEQDSLKLDTKVWLRSNGRDYAWLAQQCFVTESTVRNWMARKPIPEAKAHIIRSLIAAQPLTMPAARVAVKEETLVTFALDTDTRKALEEKAFSQGKTLSEYLADAVETLCRS